MRLTLLIWLAGGSLCCAQPLPLRAPAVPLVTHDPYFSIWSPADQLTNLDTVHWTGRPHALRGTIRVDGELYRVIGQQPAAVRALPQVSVVVWPTRTVYCFANGQVKLMLTFLTPALPSDLDVLARPVTYVTWEVQAADGLPHRVELELGISGELAVNVPEQPVLWDRPQIADLTVLRVGSQTQNVLGRKGDDLRIEWGYAYLAAPQAAQPRVIGQDTLRLELGEVSASPVTRHLLLAYDDLFSIDYFGVRLRPYCRRHGDDAADLLRAAERDYAALVEK